MIRPEEPERRKSLLDRLPKLGKLSQLMLLVGIFLILVIPLGMLYLQQPARQMELKGTLSNLERILEAPTTEKENLERELRQAEAGLEAARAAFLSPDQSPEVIDRLLELAESNDIDVTKAQVSVAEDEEEDADEGASQYPVLTFKIEFDGQVPKFQNFLLALDSELLTCEVKEVTFTIAEEEGEEDTASITIDVSCYEGGE
jgi:cell division protein FtsL